MLEILGEDRERIEELHREIKKEQERIAIRSLIATQKALMMLEGMSLQVTLLPIRKDALFCYNDPS